MPRSRHIARPPQLTVGGWRKGGYARVLPSGKSPKLRFQPGTYVELEGQLYEILYAFRLENDPHEWLYYLEERKDLYGTTDALGEALLRMGAGSRTPRVVFELFRDTTEAWQFFSDIPANGDRRCVPNKQMLRAKIISSGTVSQR